MAERDIQEACKEGGKEEVLFLKKKNQKDFCNLGPGRWRRHSPWPKVTEVFWFAGGPAFFLKNNIF
jgi:hypothetical protein